MKGLPMEYDTFCTVITQQEKESTLMDFKKALRNFEENHRQNKDDKHLIIKMESFHMTSRRALD